MPFEDSHLSGFHFVVQLSASIIPSSLLELDQRSARCTIRTLLAFGAELCFLFPVIVLESVAWFCEHVSGNTHGY